MSQPGCGYSMSLPSSQMSTLRSEKPSPKLTRPSMRSSRCSSLMVPVSDLQPGRALPLRGQPMSRSKLLERDGAAVELDVAPAQLARAEHDVLDGRGALPRRMRPHAADVHVEADAARRVADLLGQAPLEQARRDVALRSRPGWRPAPSGRAPPCPRRAPICRSPSSRRRGSTQSRCGETSMRPDGTTSVSLPSRPRGTSSAAPPLPPPMVTQPVTSGRAEIAGDGELDRGRAVGVLEQAAEEVFEELEADAGPS